MIRSTPDMLDSITLNKITKFGGRKLWPVISNYLLWQAICREKLSHLFNGS